MYRSLFYAVVVLACKLENLILATTGLKYIYFTGMDQTTWHDAKENCIKMNGKLAKKLSVSDWELQSDNVQSFLMQLYWIGLSFNGQQWVWYDGSEVDLNDTHATPLQPDYAANITYNCVLWNPVEPFYIPSHCNDIQSYVCELETGTTCSFTSKPKESVNETGWNVVETESIGSLNPDAGNTSTNTLLYISLNVSNVTECEAQCEMHRDSSSHNLECWVAEYRPTSLKTCRLLMTEGIPTTVTFQPEKKEVNLLNRFCFDLTAFLNDTCDCRCINISAPTSMTEALSNSEKVKKELIVSTRNLSASVRKKISAPDERKSSSGMGYVGMAAIGILLSALILTDISSIFADIKTMISNLKGVEMK